MSDTAKRRNFSIPDSSQTSKFTFRSTAELIARVDEVAEGEGVSRTWMLNILVEEALNGRRKKKR